MYLQKLGNDKQAKVGLFPQYPSLVAHDNIDGHIGSVTSTHKNDDRSISFTQFHIEGAVTGTVSHYCKFGAKNNIQNFCHIEDCCYCRC